MVEGSRTRSTFFVGGNAVDEFKEVTWRAMAGPNALRALKSCLPFRPVQGHYRAVAIFSGVALQVRHLVSCLALGPRRRWQWQARHARVLRGVPGRSAGPRRETAAPRCSKRTLRLGKRGRIGLGFEPRIRIEDVVVVLSKPCQKLKQALRRLGYVGNIRTLWHLLDGGNAGSRDTCGSELIMKKSRRTAD